MRAWRSTLLLQGLILCLLWLGGSDLHAQSGGFQNAGAQGTAVPTLQVYTDLVQIPVLVLERDGMRLNEPLAASRFSVSIGNGPWFHTTHVHIEGDEPISLSILLDVNGNSRELMTKADEAIADLAPALLQASDHVSLYSLDCTLTRGLNDVPAEPESLKRGVDAVLGPWTARRQAGKEDSCKQTVHLRDALAWMIYDTRKLPGHRVIVVVTNGEDWSSHISWSDLKSYAQTNSVAIFAVKYWEPVMGPVRVAGTLSNTSNACVVSGSSGMGCSKIALYWSAKEDPFNSVCQLSGGSVLLSSKGFLWDTLMWVTTMLRERYIVEYPRPANSTAGLHSLDVRVDKGNYVILPSGTSFPPLNPAVLADPTTIASDPTHAPQQGGRQVLPKLK